MKIFRGFGQATGLVRPVVTVGSFDGVHAGHRQLLAAVRARAEAVGGESTVVTFSPHPRQVVTGGDDVRLLTTDSEKALLLERAGIDNLVIAPFTPEFSRLSSHDFVRECLIGQLGAVVLVVGYNHHFGHGKQGDFNSLEEMSSRLGFDIYMVQRHDVGEDKVSSTVIRNMIAGGDVAAAARYLGYPYFVKACVLDDGTLMPDGAAKLLPPAGSYPVEVSDCGAARYATLTVGADGRMSLGGETGDGACDTVTLTFI